MNNLNNFDLDKFNKLMNQANETISCDTACMQKKREDELNQQYLEAEGNVQSAPQKLFTAKKEYITFTKGINGYNEYLDNELQQKANDIANTFKTNFNNSVNILESNIANYYGLLINFNNVVDLYKKYKYENQEIEKNLKQVSSDVITNDRKSYYEDEALSRLKTYYYFLMLIYIFIVLIFFISIFLVETNVRFYVRITILILLILYPFLSSWIYKILQNLFTSVYKNLPKNIYTTL